MLIRFSILQFLITNSSGFDPALFRLLPEKPVKHYDQKVGQNDEYETARHDDAKPETDFERIIVTQKPAIDY